MFWLYVIVILISFIFGILNVPQWGILTLFILFVLAVFYMTIYPILLQRDLNKIMQFLKKSKHGHYQFIYYLMNEDLETAESALNGVRSKNLRNIDRIMLLIKQKRFDEAREILGVLKDHVYKWYYGAIIAIEEKDEQTYLHNKEKLTDPILLLWLEVAEKDKKGQKAEAIAMLEEKMVKLRGLKLLSTAQYKKELEQE